MMLSGAHVLGILTFQAHLNGQMLHWRSKYNLDDSQVTEIRRIEENYHGNGSPFFAPSSTLDEIRAHEERIAAKMSKADGRRFIQDQAALQSK